MSAPLPNPALAAEHGALLDVCKQLLDVLGAGTGLLRPSRRVDGRHYDYVDRMELLRGTLASALDLVALNDYPSAFAILRTGLEHHLIDRLVFLANRLQYRYRVPTAQISAEDARLRTLQATTRPDIVRWRVLGREFTVIITGIHETGRIGKPPTISPYWFMLDRYDPFTGKRQYQSRLARQFSSPKWHHKAADEAWDLWKSRFSPASLTRSLLTNRLLTTAQVVQVDVHYGFLSAFVHPSARAADLALGRNRPRPDRAYDHYCSELGLLYIAAIAVAELDVFARACRRRPSCALNGWPSVQADLAAAEAAASHFWFLSGGPHELDRFHEANSRMARGLRAGRAVVRVDPASLRPEQVRYYRNPLVRIVELHQTIRELSTGLAYVSPFPRSDAWHRI